MSMNVYVKGLKPITEDYKKRLEIYKGCKELKINPPEEIIEYIENHREFCEEGIIVNLEDEIIKKVLTQFIVKNISMWICLSFQKVFLK